MARNKAPTKKSKLETSGYCVLKLPRKYRADLIAATKIPPFKITMADVMARGIELAAEELKAADVKRQISIYGVK